MSGVRTIYSFTKRVDGHNNAENPENHQEEITLEEVVCVFYPQVSPTKIKAGEGLMMMFLKVEFKDRVFTLRILTQHDLPSSPITFILPGGIDIKYHIIFNYYVYLFI